MSSYRVLEMSRSCRNVEMPRCRDVETLSYCEMSNCLVLEMSRCLAKCRGCRDFEIISRGNRGSIFAKSTTERTVYRRTRLHVDQCELTCKLKLSKVSHY